MELFEDLQFQDNLLSLAARHDTFLRDHFRLLSPDDFKPTSGKATERWTLATIILEHYQTHYEPIGNLLPFALKKHLKTVNASKEARARLLEMGDDVLKRKLRNRSLISEALVDFKKSVARTQAINQLIEANSSGELTDDEMQRIVAEAVNVGIRKNKATDLAVGIEDRIRRRLFGDGNRYPALLIDPLDLEIRAIARAHLGVLVAPMKRGKSLGLSHIAGAYAFQGLNVLYVSLEDPKKDVEDRFDSMFTAIEIRNLKSYPKKTKRLMNQFVQRYRGKIYTYDGTDEEMSVQDIERLFLETQHSTGIQFDSLIVDYDDEIKPIKKRVERRFEFADIYRDLRKLAAKQNILLWTAAQTNRASLDAEIVTEKYVAEDISKLRKCSLAISIGKHPHSEQALNLYVMVHRNDRKHIVVPIVSDTARMMFYDFEGTQRLHRDIAMGAAEEAI